MTGRYSDGPCFAAIKKEMLIQMLKNTNYISISEEHVKDVKHAYTAIMDNYIGFWAYTYYDRGFYHFRLSNEKRRLLFNNYLK